MGTRVVDDNSSCYFIYGVSYCMIKSKITEKKTRKSGDGGNCIKREIAGALKDKKKIIIKTTLNSRLSLK